MITKKISDRDGALVISVLETHNIERCDSGAMFNFTLSLLSDFFQALAVGARSYFIQVATLHVQKRKKSFYSKSSRTL